MCGTPELSRRLCNGSVRVETRTEKLTGRRRSAASTGMPPGGARSAPDDESGSKLPHSITWRVWKRPQTFMRRRSWCRRGRDFHANGDTRSAPETGRSSHLQPPA
jgi:hypothetical protein